MALNIEPLPGKFGIQVSDIDIPNISVKKLRDLLFNLYEHRVVVLKAIQSANRHTTCVLLVRRLHQ